MTTMFLNHTFVGPIDGRDEEEMGKIVADLEAAVDGLPITFRVVPFDSPCLIVYGPYDKVIGTLMWTTDSLTEPVVYEWWAIHSKPGRTDQSKHGASARAGLARLINIYVDSTVA